MSFRERLRALKYLKHLEEEQMATGTTPTGDLQEVESPRAEAGDSSRLHQINRAMRNIRRKMSDRFKNSKTRQYVAEVLTERERAMKVRIDRGRAKLNEVKEDITRTVKENVDRGVGKVKSTVATVQGVHDRHLKPVVRAMITGDRDTKVSEPELRAWMLLNID